MKYTAEELQKIKLALALFDPYIEQNPYFDIVYSDATGYLQITREEAYGDTIATPIKTTAELLEMMFDEYVDDVRDLKLPGWGEGPTLSEAEINETRKRLKSIIDLLDGYKEYCTVFLNWYLEHYDDEVH